MSEPDSTTLGLAPPKRPRPVISCLTCRRKKLKCSRTHPCQQCIKIGKPGRCEFQDGQEPEPNINYSAAYSVSNKRPRLDPPISDIENQASMEWVDLGRQEPATAKQGVVEDLQERVTRLEQALLGQVRLLGDHPHSSTTSPDQLRIREDLEQSHIAYKATQISSQFDDACMFMTRLQNDTSNRKMLNLRTDLQILHHSVEANHRAQITHRMETSTITELPVQLPPLEVCEKLALLYFDNMEHCFRVLHWPEFKDQLITLFTSGERACKPAFLPQLLAALAIAVILGTHQECEAARASIKPNEAIRSIEHFLSNLRQKENYSLPALQVKILLLICRWLVRDPFEDLFKLGGELLRDALVMRMDRELPDSADMSVFEGEMRRKCWMTIVEVDLMLSILCKMPCLVPRYSSRPPRNLNDDDISESMVSLPDSRSTTEWTDGLCQFLLAQTFQRRAAACTRLDNPDRVSGKELLPHIHYLEKVLQDLPAPLRFNYSGDTASKTPARLMARMELDISIRRPLMHLYQRGILSLDVTTARKHLRPGFLQSCLMVANYQDLFDPQYSELDVPRPRGYWDFFYSCYRQELGQALLGLCLEIRILSHAVQTYDTALPTSATPPSILTNLTTKAPSYTSENLITAAQDSLEPMRRRLPYRASSVKDIVYYEIILSSLRPHQPGGDKEAEIIRRLQNLVHECQDELRGAAVLNLTAPLHGSQLGEPVGQFAGNVTSFDPLWEDFPTVDIFEPLEFSTS